MNRRPWYVAAAVALLLALGVAPEARAAVAPALTRTVGFGSNPGNLLMYSYRPAGLADGRPVVLALHGCTQSASDYFGHAGWDVFAARWQFTVVLPEQQTANNFNRCFNWFQPADTTRGQGETLSIRQMVDHAVRTWRADPARVYVTGLSAGGAMTNVMLAAYPDVFAAGAVVGGLAYRCATDLMSALTCMNTPPAKTPRQWGDLVRGAYSGYAGSYPKVSIWHGTGDYTVAVANADRERDQWTDVWAAGQSPTGSTSLPANTTRYDYGPGVSVYLVGGMAHGTPVDPGAGPDQCGTAGQYYLDTLCSSYYIGTSWGLAA